MGIKKIAVLGGGNGAQTMAADLSLKGYEVALCEAPEFKEGIERILDRQVIELIDAFGEKHSIGINTVTTDFQEALKGASYIMIAVPAFASASFFRRIIPFLEDGQTIIKWSANFSALQFAALLKEQGIKKDITLAEAHTLPWGCRLLESGTAQIMVWAVRLMLATLPTRHTERVIKEVEPMYPVVKGGNVLATTLNNLNPVVHPVGTVMNAGWVDAAGKDFYLYRDGITLSAARGIKRVFKEVSQVAGTVGVTMLDYPEEDFWKKSTIMSTYFRAVFDMAGMANKISGPESVKSRYITEDLPYGLVPIRKLAQQYDISTPMIDSVIEFGSVINQTDYMKEGISLEELGIAGLSKEDLKQVLNEGFW